MEFPHPHVSPVGVYHMPAAVVSTEYLRHIAAELRIDRELDAREDATALSRDFAQYFGATVDFYDPFKLDIEGIEPRIGYIEPDPPRVLRLAQLGASTNRATAHILLGSWLEQQALDLLGEGPQPYGQGGRSTLTIEHTATYRLSPKSLKLAGRESGYDAANAQYFQALASMLLLKREPTGVLCEMFLRSMRASTTHLPELLARMSSNPGIANREQLMEYVAANMEIQPGPAHTTDNMLASTALAAYLADLAINKRAQMLGLD